MKKLAIIGAALGLLVTLVGCGGPSECEKAGGTEVLSHYIPITTVVSTGKSVIPVTNMVPVFNCELP